MPKTRIRRLYGIFAGDWLETLPVSDIAKRNPDTRGRNNPMLHTVRETASILRCAESTVRTLINTEELGHHRCPGIRVSDDQIEAYLATTKHGRKETWPAAKPARQSRRQAIQEWF